MPTAQRTFEVQAPVATVWAFLSDLERLGPCLPGCTGVDLLSSTEADWRMETKLGFIRKRFVVRTRTTTLEEPAHAAWTGESDDLTASGTIDLRPCAPDRTEITYQGTVKGQGPARQLLNRYFKSRLDRDIDTFVANVRAALQPEAAPISDS